MKEADVILAAFPQADGKIKKRPAILLREMPPFNDCLVCGVSSQLHQYVENFDELVLLSDIDFKESGLLSSSVIRLSFLAVLPRKRLAGSIGTLSRTRYVRLLTRLSDFLVARF